MLLIFYKQFFLHMYIYYVIFLVILIYFVRIKVLPNRSHCFFKGVHDLPSPVKKVKSLTNAERCKLYRETIKSDPQSHDAKRLKDIERFKRNYRRPRTEEELQIRRENDMLRARRCR